MPAVVVLQVLVLVAMEFATAGPGAVRPAAAATSVVDPRLDALKAEVKALVVAFPGLAADANTATNELLNASWEFVFGTWCSMADPLQRAVTALDHAESISPASIKPLAQRAAADVFALEAFVLSLSPTMCNRPDVFHVDSDVKPLTATEVDDADGATLPIGAIADEDGKNTEFVSNEIMLETNDSAKLQAFLTRFGGQVIETIPADPDETGDQAQHAIRMDPDRLLDTSRLAADLETLDPGGHGEIMRASDQQTLRLLATAARAAVEGYPVELDLAGKSDDVESDITAANTREAASGNADGGPLAWNTNAFTWPYLNNGSKQDIEVTEAWRLMNRMGRLRPAIKVGIVDRGFDPTTNGDFPANTQGIKSAVFNSPWDRSAESGKPWHGTWVANAMAGQLDNGVGAAGPAGPVVKQMTVVNRGNRTIRAATRGLRRIGREGVNIINMSFHFDYKIRFGRLAYIRFDRVIRRLRANNVLIFAAAGNDNTDVDARKCSAFGCREKRFYVPCESTGAICVGGLAHNDTTKADNSNYGTRGDVEIWAPYEVWIGKDAECSCEAKWHRGTSYSAPFAAGVAALIWVANPSLTNNQVWDIMWRTAHQVNANNVSRYVFAGAAVRDAMAPQVRILSPTVNQSFPGGTAVPLKADVYDDGKGTPQVAWVVGESRVGTGTSTSFVFPPGTWTVAAIATFPDGSQVGSQVAITVGSPPPPIG